METTFFLKSLSLFHCVPLYVCRLCINFQDLCARLLGMAALRILLLTFISRFVIDFLSIRKVIIFILYTADLVIFKYISLFFFFMATKVNRSTKSDFFYKFPKIIIKKRITKKKN